MDLWIHNETWGVSGRGGEDADGDGEVVEFPRLHGVEPCVIHGRLDAGEAGMGGMGVVYRMKIQALEH